MTLIATGLDAGRQRWPKSDIRSSRFLTRVSPESGHDHSSKNQASTQSVTEPNNNKKCLRGLIIVFKIWKNVRTVGIDVTDLNENCFSDFLENDRFIQNEHIFDERLKRYDKK